ncbi:MAG: response regulator [Gemmatimonadota bacterium]
MNSRLSAPAAALEAACAPLGKAGTDALPSVRRIASRVRDAAATLGLPELARIASEIMDSDRPDEVRALAKYLIEQLRAVPADGTALAPILLVEDDLVTAQMLSDELRKRSWQIVVAGTAKQAYAILGQTEISLAILDIVLPDADGRDLIVSMRENPATRTTPILVMTARADPETHSESLALGAQGVLRKPVHPDVLHVAVANELQQVSERRIEARMDRLTGLPNRAAFSEALDRALPILRAHRRPISVAMLDIDNFKAVNDEHGHAVGDDVLRQVGSSISNSLRVSDFVARWGGEEFCLFMPGTTPEGAVIGVEKALAEVRGLRFVASAGGAFHVTFSAGIAELTPDQTPAEAIAKADQLLYNAKAAGRNRVLFPGREQTPLRPTVLLVEDDKAVAQMVTRLLEREGLTVTWVSDGEAALEAAAQHTFALGIFDVGLPTMDGFELLTRLRSQPIPVKWPIVMLTASNDEADVVRGFDLGVNDYVGKPFNAAELTARVKRLLKGR